MSNNRVLIALQTSWRSLGMVVLSIAAFIGTCVQPTGAFRSLSKARGAWGGKSLWGSKPGVTGAGYVRSTLEEATTPAGTRMPSVVHQVLQPGEVKSRVIIVGDVHGCLDELKALLEKAGYNSSKDSVVLVGDLVNKGPKSLEVVRYVREQKFFCVRGNHDDSALAAYYRVGRYKEVEPPAGYSYVKNFTKDDVNWLDNLAYTLTLPPEYNAVVVHAGLVPGVPLPSQTASNMSKMRNIETAEDGSNFALEGIKAGRAWVDVWKGPEHVYFGHDARRGFQQTAYATGLDTGCCYGRELTAIVLPSREVLSVKAFKAYVKAEGD